jgi:DNA topoisomerase-1
MSDEAVPRGLVYVSDDAPGIRRVKRGNTFAYKRPDGRWLAESRKADAQEIARIRRLAIPPAYTDVWIAPQPHAHLQATGRDARGRKQYRYHPEWRRARDADKFEHMLDFGRALPKIRARVTADLAAPVGKVPSRDTVLATLVRLLDTTLVRVGNDEYARQNGSFGLTTLRDRHAAVSGSVLRLRFKGKSGVVHEVTLEDPRVARVVRRCQAVPGQELFQYEGDDGAVRSVGSADVNDYLRECSGADLTAKDFRTWHATVHALDLMCVRCQEGPVSAKAVNEVLAEVCSRLGNTVAVCRKSYVHPDVLDGAGLAASLERLDRSTAAVPKRGLDAAERRLLRFLADSRIAISRGTKSTTRSAKTRASPNETSAGPGRGSGIQRLTGASA